VHAESLRSFRQQHLIIGAKVADPDRTNVLA